jgi:hypothetical protein
MISLVSFLKERADEAFALIVKAMADVDDDILHWEPAPNSRGLRPKNGYWIPDYDQPQPLPPGPKTIGWLAAHIATCKEMYFEYAFGPGKKQWHDLIIPGDSQGLRKYIEHSHRPLMAKLDELAETDLEKLVSTNCGEKKPIWWIYWIMIYHDIEHGGQIFQIKREYIRPLTNQLTGQ